MENNLILVMGINGKNFRSEKVVKRLNCKFWKVWRLKYKIDQNMEYEVLLTNWRNNKLEYLLVW